MTDTDTPETTPQVNPYDAARAMLDRLEAADVPCPSISLNYHSTPDELATRVFALFPDHKWAVTESWITGTRHSHPKITVFIPVQDRRADDPTTAHARNLLAKAQS